jgi:outer membrane receptor for ferrienterochelin and colicins
MSMVCTYRTGPSGLRRIFAASVLALFVDAIPLWAQSEAAVRGQVVAAADRTPFAGVVVSLKSVPAGDSQRATTDAQGWFAFQDVRPGEYLLSSSHDGFAPREIRFVLKPREIKAITLALELSRVEVNVHVTGEVTLPSTHSPSSTVLSAERIDMLPLAQRVNLPEAIVTSAPGMIRGHDDFVHIRGHEVALNPLLNGVSFWENPHSVFSGGLSPDVIESANVMTGSFSAEYGNRFGGVVDIVTRSGLGMHNDGSVTINAGEAGRRSLTGDFGGHRGKVGYYAFGSAFNSHRFLSPPDPEAIHDDARGGHAFGQIDADLGKAGSLRIVLLGDGANLQIPKTPLDDEVRPEANPTQRTRQQSAIVGWTRPISSDLVVSASFYERWSQLHLFPAAGPLTAQASVDRELATIGGKADVTRLAGRHTIKGGVDTVWLQPHEDLFYDYSGYRNLAHLIDLPHIHITDNAIAFSGEDSGGQISAYVQDAIQLGPRFTVDAGVRVDRYDLVVATTHASPRINAAYQLGKSVLHASYNHFFVPPPIEGILSSSAGLTASIREIGVALPPLEPTTENQFELGATTAVGPARVGMTGYFRATENPVHTTVWPDSRIYSYASFDRARAYGLEAKAELPMLARYGVTAYLNYALGRVYFYNPVTGGFVTEAEHLAATNRFLAPMDQTHTLTAGLTYRHAASGVWGGTTMEYGSGTPMGHGDEGHEHAEGEEDHDHPDSAGSASRVPGHFTANLTAGVDLVRGARYPRVTLRLDIENVTNNVYLIAQEGEFAAGQFFIPRLISATARIRF